MATTEWQPYPATGGMILLVDDEPFGAVHATAHGFKSSIADGDGAIVLEYAATEQAGMAAVEAAVADALGEGRCVA